jgi:HSP20 family protein
MRYRHRQPDPAREWRFAMFPSFPAFPRLFDDLFTDAEGREMIKVEQFTEEGAFVLRAEMPGIDPDKDVEITIEGDLLHIRAERREEEEKTERDFHRRELRYGAFARTVPLPDGVDEGGITAGYKDGILEVRAPLRTEPPAEEARRVPIGRG